MKGKIITTVMAVTLTGIFLTALALPDPEEKIAAPRPEAELSVEIEAEPILPEGFWVCELDGVIAVYHNADRAAPIETTTIPVHTLRAADQALLRGGVYFADYLDVALFMEDFGP